MGDRSRFTALEQARAALQRRDWTTAHERFIAARERGALSADDIDALSDAAWWLGRVEEALDAAEEAHRLHVEAGEPRKAASAALLIAYTRSLRGEESAASGWMSRAVRLLEDQPDCPEHGFVTYVQFEAALAAPDLDTALDRARQVRAIGERFDDPNLLALGVMGEGRVLVKQGRVADGMTLLDEAMVGAVSDRLAPSWAGNIYCHMMIACHELGDLRRAGEWTTATVRWCESMPGAGPFMGICRVHRAQLFHLQGAWEAAEQEVVRVCEEFRHFHLGIVAEAWYYQGEIRRHRGDLDGAEEAYRRANRIGRDPQPGLALVRLAQGRVDAAAASIQAALAAAPRDRLGRARLLVARVEIALAAGDMEGARAACAELDETARLFGSSGLIALALHARGALFLAAGEAAAAVETLRSAAEYWRDLAAPYESARVRALLARACEALGDTEAAALEYDGAEAEFQRLGLSPEAAVAAGLRRGWTLPGGLSEGEAEVLAFVAAGKTNREIAESLVISEKTVARHLSNIFTKLDLTSRTAAAAYAFEHGLASPRDGAGSPDG